MPTSRRRRAPRRRANVNEQLDAIYQQIPDVGCKGLCQSSCGSVGMTALEQRRIAGRGVSLPPLVGAFLGFGGPGGCPALRGGRCSVYRVRPTVCRLWGAVESMPCPHGCEPAGGLMPEAQGQQLMIKVMNLSDRAEARDGQ